MSIIVYKITEHTATVAADSRVMVDGDKISSENFQKIYKLSDSLIIGCTGQADTLGIYKKFVEDNLRIFENIDNTTVGLPMFKRLKEYFINNYGFSEETIKEFGGFLVVNKNFHGVFYFDDHLSPYCVGDLENAYAYGSTRKYTLALLEYGLEPDEAIKESAKKYTSINNNVILFEISLR